MREEKGERNERRKEREKATKNTNSDFDAFDIVKKISMRQTLRDLKISLEVARVDCKYCHPKIMVHPLVFHVQYTY